MVAAVRVHKIGGPEVLTFEEVDVPAPGPGQIRIRQRACGLNFIDTYFRSGLYAAPAGLPLIPGHEGAGEVVAVGPGVTDLKVGDRVTYVLALGGYSAERVLPAERALKLPDGVGFDQAAGMMLKGMTACYLLRRLFKVEKGMNVLIHAAAGGVGVIACQWANLLGANVIGTVGSPEKGRSPRRTAAITSFSIATRISPRASRTSPAVSCARWSMTASAARPSRRRSTACGRAACS